ncbi:UDP-glucose 4-epimerase GalE [Isoptericola sp. NEAU-Y5]|uniref:UDP-glucose 4-epimerase n=1 Tax=Isoptericola luteus TaxID=2879484 RepID=A0ABS7ZIA1_9MICO|nr:UDP-glucose 4-epimerase GalE [Isoptericola sp. NEAU-Y5]MCA5894658.1 UDP-glucose 4-epimerase GalE [Isoptericola sp. NEAU-Y5]
MRILVTGGAGYLGSHVTVALTERGHDVVVVDDLSAGNPAAVSRAEALTGARIPLHAVDVADIDALERIFDTERVEAVVHLAGRRPSGGRAHGPLDYYETNLGATFTLLRCMVWYGVDRLVAASTGAVYGSDPVVPSHESGPRADSSFGRAALMAEQVLADVARANRGLRTAALRCFSVAGAHPSGTIGEHAPRGGGLFSMLGQVALGQRDELDVHGGDHPTPDGTPVRDVVHVDDVAGAFVAALDALGRTDRPFSAWNAGSGRPASVLELVRTFAEAVGQRIPYRVVDRRPGDVAVSCADPTLAAEELGWRPRRTLEDACVDHWRWQSRNPAGYPGLIGGERPWRGGVGHRLRVVPPLRVGHGA